MTRDGEIRAVSLTERGVCRRGPCAFEVLGTRFHRCESSWSS
jgi:hypothetical protein